MKKIVSFLLAVLSCCVFASAVSADAQQPAAASPSDAPVTQTSTSAQGFAGTVRITHDNVPVNTDLIVTIGVEGATLTEGDVIRYCLYDGSVSCSDADKQWVDYTGPAAVSANTVIEAAVFFADGSRSQAAVSTITCIDKTAPELPRIEPSTTQWTKEPVMITVSGGSDAQSGLQRLEYRIGADGVWTEYTDKISISAAGKVFARSVDRAGNMSEAAVLEVSNFDVTPPDVTAMVIGLSSDGKPVIADTGAFGKYYGSQVTAKPDGAADAESGVAGYQYQMVSSAEAVREDKWQKFDPSDPPVISGDFCGYVYARAVDAVGNCSLPVASDGFVIDVTPPVIDNVRLSDENITGSRVIVTFTVKDNYALETVTVNGTYAGIYISSFTAFRNDDYLIVAIDKVGNRSEQLVQITNINTTPFTLLDTWKGMNPQDFTPATWAEAEKAANELETLITLDAPQAQVEAAAGKLLTALEGLVTRGDGTLSRELIERVKAYDSSMYTESSWALLQESIAGLELVLNNPESTQEAVDVSRRALEQRLSELVKRADFTDLDRLISQCERMNTDAFSAATHKVFTEALEHAKELSRTDSDQTAADAAYEQLLAAMGGLEIHEKGGINFTPIMTVILGLLIVAAATALLIVRLRAKEIFADKDNDDEEDAVEESVNGYGDICFTDEADDQTVSEAVETAVEKKADEGGQPAYIGHRSKK